MGEDIGPKQEGTAIVQVISLFRPQLMDRSNIVNSLLAVL